MLVAIIACEIGFWVVLAAGLLTRYVLRRPRLGGALLLGVPLVDAVLLVLTAVDLGSGAAPDATHGLAALYLGFSVAFGHDLVRWADVRVAHRFAGGPPPAPAPPSGTSARVRKEWRDYGLFLLGAAVAAGVLAGLAAVTGPGVDDSPLWGPLAPVGIVAVTWLLGWPVWETARALSRAGAGSTAVR
ncbi:hypothetical protein [Blastococcus sp. KM273129]|uniref:hypothetical protein n=1 Tax=Blastococcus sp. KM273129 TaxID=2570315 RepID=UPI001F1C71B6|nr:hypothetical protein [Blastococcus sp. KM273129]MCF6734437.1 hypothetical protein [Blastococcus sp. KM273129]